MAKGDDYRPRVTIEVTEDQFQRIQKIPWGVRRHVFAKIFEDFLALYENHGAPILGAILAGDVAYGKEYKSGND